MKEMSQWRSFSSAYFSQCTFKCCRTFNCIVAFASLLLSCSLFYYLWPSCTRLSILIYFFGCPTLFQGPSAYLRYERYLWIRRKKENSPARFSPLFLHSSNTFAPFLQENSVSSEIIKDYSFRLTWSKHFRLHSAIAPPTRTVCVPRRAKRHFITIHSRKTETNCIRSKCVRFYSHQPFLLLFFSLFLYTSASLSDSLK